MILLIDQTSLHGFEITNEQAANMTYVMVSSACQCARCSKGEPHGPFIDPAEHGVEYYEVSLDDALNATYNCEDVYVYDPAAGAYSASTVCVAL